MKMKNKIILFAFVVISSLALCVGCSKSDNLEGYEEDTSVNTVEEATQEEKADGEIDLVMDLFECDNAKAKVFVDTLKDKGISDIDTIEFSPDETITVEEETDETELDNTDEEEPEDDDSEANSEIFVQTTDGKIFSVEINDNLDVFKVEELSAEDIEELKQEIESEEGETEEEEDVETEDTESMENLYQ